MTKNSTSVKKTRKGATRNAKPRVTKKSTPRAARSPRSTSGGLRAGKKEAIQKKIVSAALKLFQTKGFEATTTKSIARKAGIAEGTVFNYFKTKEDIALYFFEQEVDQAIATVRRSPSRKCRKGCVQSSFHGAPPTEFR